MKTIIEPYEKVKAVLYTKYPGSENGWRPAQWVVPYSAEGVYLMKNTFSGEVVHLTEEEFSAPESVEELKKRRFVVPEDYNEAEQYTQTIRLIKLMQRETPGLKTYTILPTTACNARCTYCYEQGFEHQAYIWADEAKCRELLPEAIISDIEKDRVFDILRKS